MITYQNYTDHPIRIINTKTGIMDALEPSRNPIRVTTLRTHTEPLPDGMQVVSVRHATVDLPPRKQNTIFVVSNYALHVIRDQYPERDDVVAPDTSDDSAIKDRRGRIVAVRRLARNAGWQP